MKSLFLLAAVLFFLFSCERDVYHNIPKNEKPLLKDKDTVVFMERGSKELDSFLIKRSEDYRVSDKRYYYEEIFVQYYSLNKSTSIKKFGFGHGYTTSISFGGNNFPNYGNADPKDVEVNGITYHSVFVIYATYLPDSIPQAICYSHQYGIIRYSYSDGRCYELK
jgi:hypothetical protein